MRTSVELNKLIFFTITLALLGIKTQSNKMLISVQTTTNGKFLMRLVDWTWDCQKTGQGVSLDRKEPILRLIFRMASVGGKWHLEPINDQTAGAVS